MWSPTHVQVTVQRTKQLKIKNKHAKNDIFVTIGLGKEKFQTSSKEKDINSDTIEWNEMCELLIPKNGNSAELILNILHTNFIGLDQFLGQIVIPLADIDVYERPKSKWYVLKNKSGIDDKPRGELQLKIAFTVKSGSLLDLSKKEKHRISAGHLSHTASNISNSLMSINSVDKKSFKKLAKTITSKIKREKNIKEISTSDINLSNGSPSQVNNKSSNIDPGVNSDDDDFALLDLSHASSVCSLETSNKSDKKVSSNHSSENIVNSDTTLNIPDEWQNKIFKNKENNTLKLSDTLKSKFKDIVQLHKDVSPTHSLNSSPKVEKKHKYNDDSFVNNELKHENESPSKNKSALSSWNKAYDRIIIGKEKDSNNISHSRLSSEVIQKFDGKSRDDLIEMIIQLQNTLCDEINKNSELTLYLDKLLLRVMETTPKILQTPYICHS